MTFADLKDFVNANQDDEHHTGLGQAELIHRAGML
jgi:hypothetical protein